MAEIGAVVTAEHVSPWVDAWRKFRRHKLAVASSVALLTIIAAVIVGPWLWPVSINDIDFTARLQGPSRA
ncbi:MAG: ABC transporter permease, partial [Reyranella sp.]